MKAMHNNEEHIEQQLWMHIDGECNGAEQERIAALIAHDAAWGVKYKELKAMHSGLSDPHELEHPPLRFTKNVMDAITATYPVTAPKKYINQGIIRGVAAVFIVSIIILLALTFSTADWSAPAQQSNVSLPNFNFRKLLVGPVINVFIAANVVLGLLLLDLTLRSKRTLHP